MIAGPLYGEEGMLVADCDLRVSLHAKRWFDAVGHYSREDVLARLVMDGNGDGMPVVEPASPAESARGEP